MAFISNLPKLLKAHLGFLLFAGVFCIVAWINFPVNSWLIGWDSLHPELNFAQNLEYALQPAWQPHYGTGTLVGHGYGATLPHVIITWFLSWFMPLAAIRPAFIFVTWFLGGSGVYFLLKTLLPQPKKKEPENIWITESVALFGALFYSFNLGTTQIFYLPLEAFTVHFAVLPWTLLYLERYLKRPTVKGLLILFGIVFVGSVQGFIPSTFLAYGIIMTLFLASRVILQPKKLFLPALTSLVTIALANFYWATSFLYYTLTHQETYQHAYNNIIATPTFLAQSSQYGDIVDVITFKSFFLDSSLFGEAVFQPWVTFLQNYPITLGYYFIFAIGMIPIFVGLLSKKYRPFTAFILPTLFLFTTLATNQSPFKEMNNFIYTNLPLYEQAFRTAFTKTGLGFFLMISLLAAAGLHFLLHQITSKRITFAASLLPLILLALLSLPHLQGHSFYDHIKKQLPQSYLETISFFQNQPADGYVVQLPIGCAEGWYSYDWDYTGSGFYWYGLPQPVLARSFDVWNQYNEAFYWQANRAIREQDFESLDTLFDNYQVSWLIYDPQLLHCQNQELFEEQEALLSFFNAQDHYHLALTTQTGIEKPIQIYQRTNQQQSKIDITYTETNNSLTDVILPRKQTGIIEYAPATTPSGQVFSARGDNTQPISINEDIVEIIATDQSELSLTLEPQPLANQLIPKPCSSKATAQPKYELDLDDNNEPEAVHLESNNQSDCIQLSFVADELSAGTLLHFSTRNEAGLPFKLVVQDNLGNKYIDIFVQENENTVIVPPLDPEANTLNIIFTNNYLGSGTAKNILSQLLISSFPTTKVEQVLLPEGSIHETTVAFVSPPNVMETVSIGQEQYLLVLMSYDPGWVAWQGGPWKIGNIFTQPLPHYRYNRWANAWQIQDSDTQVTLLYWPTVLAWLGYGLTILAGLTLGLLTLLQPSSPPLSRFTHYAELVKKALGK